METLPKPNQKKEFIKKTKAKDKTYKKSEKKIFNKNL